jgi:putative ABC transport system permease protein
MHVAALQRDVVRQFPNVSSVDLSLITQTIGQIVAKVSAAIQYLAVFTVIMGIPVLISAVAATRRERVREGVLLRTLGATRAQVRRILLTEYAVLGLLGSLTGFVLALGGGWALMHFVFKMAYVPEVGAAVVITALMMGVTIAIGLLTGRDVFRETAMAALRAEM